MKPIPTLWLRTIVDIVSVDVEISIYNGLVGQYRSNPHYVSKEAQMHCKLLKANILKAELQREMERKKIEQDKKDFSQYVELLFAQSRTPSESQAYLEILKFCNNMRDLFIKCKEKPDQVKPEEMNLIIAFLQMIKDCNRGRLGLYPRMLVQSIQESETADLPEYN